MIPAAQERGAALITVLVLVAVIGAIAASALERLRFATALGANSSALDQARGYAGGVEMLITLQIDDLLARDPGSAPLEMDPAGQVRTISLPEGGTVTARVRDGANCFNLNSLAQGNVATGLRARPIGVAQFTGLLRVVGVPEGKAQQVAAAAADWIDSDTSALPGGAEDSAYASYRTANGLFVDASELRAVSGVTAELYQAVRPYLCALPVTDLSPINVNGLAPDQAPLLAMVSPEQIPADVARAAIAARPPGGWRSVQAFWNSPALTDRFPTTEIASQFAVRPQWVRLDIDGAIAGTELFETALVDARRAPSRVVQRSWARES